MRARAIPRTLGTLAGGRRTFPRSHPLDKEARRLGNQGYSVNEYSSEELSPERVQRLARRLRELEASGVELHRILAGESGVAFIRDECGGDADIAAAAFTLVHSCAGSGRVGDR
jgi:hypothetical protein